MKFEEFAKILNEEVHWIFFSGFFRVDFSGENFPDIFSGFYFPAFFLA